MFCAELDLATVLGMTSFKDVELEGLEMGTEDVPFLSSNTRAFHEIRSETEAGPSHKRKKSTASGTKRKHQKLHSTPMQKAASDGAKSPPAHSPTHSRSTSLEILSRNLEGENSN